METKITDIAQIISAIFVGIAALIAVATYFRFYIQKQGETLREYLFNCERDLDRLYKEYDTVAMVHIVNQIISHPRLVAFAETIFNFKDEPKETLNSIIEDYTWDISMAIYSSVTLSKPSGDRSYCTNYKISMEKVRQRYPVLYVFLTRIYRLMNYALKITEKTETYFNLTIETVKKVIEQDDIKNKKMQSADQFLSFVSVVILQNIKNQIKNQNLNEALEALGEFQTSFFDYYRKRSDFGLYLISRKETTKVASTCDKGDISGTLKAILHNKRKYFKQSELLEIGALVGKAETILKMDFDE